MGRRRAVRVVSREGRPRGGGSQVGTARRERSDCRSRWIHRNPCIRNRREDAAIRIAGFGFGGGRPRFLARADEGGAVIPEADIGRSERIAVRLPLRVIQTRRAVTRTSVLPGKKSKLRPILSDNPSLQSASPARPTRGFRECIQRFADPTTGSVARVRGGSCGSLSDRA